MMLEISRSVLDAITLEAAASPGLEVCGLLFGTTDRIDASRPCANVAPCPADSFEIDPAALIAAHRAERGGEAKIAGCYHSHPAGPASPSISDAAAADANGWIWLIASAEHLRAYRAVAHGAIHGRFESVAIRVGSDA